MVAAETRTEWGETMEKVRYVFVKVPVNGLPERTSPVPIVQMWSMPGLGQWMLGSLQSGFEGELPTGVKDATDVVAFLESRG